MAGQLCDSSAPCGKRANGRFAISSELPGSTKCMTRSSGLYSHGDVATKRHGPCCRGTRQQFYGFCERRTVRPGERELDCHGQPQHRTSVTHGDIATKPQSPCCRGSDTNFQPLASTEKGGKLVSQ